MFRPRVIPVLLLDGGALVKTTRFRRPRYLGDPINAVRIFNDLRADEVVFLDVRASREGRTIPPDFVRQVGEEADMPFAVGGGVRSLEDIRTLVAAGAEKVVLGTKAAQDPDFVAEAAAVFGSSTLAVCMDVKRTLFGGLRVRRGGGRGATAWDPVAFAALMEEKGAGELIVQSVDRDGTMAGYDLDTLRRVAERVGIPVVALGGAGSIRDLEQAHRAGATGLGAGSLFVFHGPHRGVLLSYPDRSELTLHP